MIVLLYLYICLMSNIGQSNYSSQGSQGQRVWNHPIFSQFFGPKLYSTITFWQTKNNNLNDMNFESFRKNNMIWPRERHASTASSLAKETNMSKISDLVTLPIPDRVKIHEMNLASIPPPVSTRVGAVSIIFGNYFSIKNFEWKQASLIVFVLKFILTV